MKLNKILLLAGITIIVSSVIFSACRKNRLTDDDLEAVNDQALAEGTSQEVQNISDQAYSLRNNATFRTAGAAFDFGGGCATVSFDSVDASNADTMYVDFGSTPCQGWDGRFRKGEIIAVYTGRYFTSGAVIDISFNNYYVGKSTTTLSNIAGTKHIINNGLNAANNMNWTVTTPNNLTVTKSDGKVITFNENKTREWIAGASTSQRNDDKFKISGTCSGTASTGKSFTATVVAGSELIRDLSCPKHFTQGVVEIVPAGKPTITIDFGNGACDNTATVTRNKRTKTITLR